MRYLRQDKRSFEMCSISHKLTDSQFSLICGTRHRREKRD